jgi:formylglycine-generating enzyme required for sulfatase activity
MRARGKTMLVLLACGLGLALLSSCMGEGNWAIGPHHHQRRNVDDDAVDDDETDDDTPADFGLTWVDLPAGEFEMGCAPNDAACLPEESPAHRVTLDAFSLTDMLITQQQYAALTGADPSFFTDCPDCPVEQVDWFDAAAFCQAVGGRLPTEAEWEYAARAGGDTIYSCGDDPTCLTDAAWYLANSAMTTQPVAQKQANAFGLYDMQGDVWEWAADWYDAGYYEGSPTDSPIGPTGGDMRVLRGGAFNNDAPFLRVSYRNHDQPDDRNRAAGFRCARDASADEEH